MTEMYKGFTICANSHGNFFYVEEYHAMAYVSAEVAKKCIDVLLRHLEERELVKSS